MFKQLFIIAFSTACIASNAFAENLLFAAPSKSNVPVSNKLPPVSSTILQPNDFTAQTNALNAQNHAAFTATLNQNIAQVAGPPPQPQTLTGNAPAAAAKATNPTSAAEAATTTTTTTAPAATTTAPSSTVTGPAPQQFSNPAPNTPAAPAQKPYTGFGSTPPSPTPQTSPNSTSNWKIYRSQ